MPSINGQNRESHDWTISHKNEQIQNLILFCEIRRGRSRIFLKNRRHSCGLEKVLSCKMLKIFDLCTIFMNSPRCLSKIADFFVLQVGYKSRTSDFRERQLLSLGYTLAHERTFGGILGNFENRNGKKPQINQNGYDKAMLCCTIFWYFCVDYYRYRCAYAITRVW